MNRNFLEEENMARVPLSEIDKAKEKAAEYVGQVRKKRLKRITSDGWIAGICAGLAYFLGLRTWMVRLIVVGLALAYGTGVVAYIVLWIFMPEWSSTPSDYGKVSGD